jgi:EmrB/QacA subfamily drug resistance transporter
MLILDVTVVNVALPHIQTDLHFSRAGLAWVVDGYVLMAGGFLLLGGRLSDLFGRRRLFLIGLAVFGLASALCGASQSSGMLVGARFVQGIGEALAAPAALGLVALLFPDPSERTKALGLWGGLAGLGGTTGTIISGGLTNIGQGTWRWIFFVNIPVAVFALVATPRLVKESRAERTKDRLDRGRPDVLGAVTITGGLVALVYGLLRASEVPWGSRSVVLSLIGGGLLLGAFVVVERTTREPLVPLRFFSNRTRVTANVVTLFFTSAFFTYFFLQTLYLQQVLQWSALKTGLAYIPVGVGIGAAIGLGTALMPKIGARWLLTVGFALAGTGLLLVSQITTTSEYVSGVLPGMVVLAIGAGLSFPAFGIASLHEVSGQDASLASGVQNAVQQVGGAIGLAVLATIALRHTSHAAASGVDQATAAVDGYALAFRVAAVVVFLGAIVAAVFMQNIRSTPVQPGMEEFALSDDSAETAGTAAPAGAGGGGAGGGARGGALGLGHAEA